MAKQVYETLFLLDPTKVSADAEGVKAQLHALIERHGGGIDISRPWDYNHKLTYPIKKQKKGSFHIVYYTCESTKVAELERDFALQPELILRQLTTKLDAKWKDDILKVARDEQGNAFALRGMQEEAQVQTDPAAIGGEVPPMGDAPPPPRRGRRDSGDAKPE